MRMKPEQLEQITGCSRKSAQVAWFKLHLGVDVPYDRHGVIMSEGAYEKLLEKRLGLGETSGRQRPVVRLQKAA